jgi:hypothetical protein
MILNWNAVLQTMVRLLVQMPPQNSACTRTRGEWREENGVVRNCPRLPSAAHWRMVLDASQEESLRFRKSRA